MNGYYHMLYVYCIGADMYGRLSLVVLLSSAFLCGMKENKSRRINPPSPMSSSAGELPVGRPEESLPVSDLKSQVVRLILSKWPLNNLSESLEEMVGAFLSGLRKKIDSTAVQTGRGG